MRIRNFSFQFKSIHQFAAIRIIHSNLQFKWNVVRLCHSHNTRNTGYFRIWQNLFCKFDCDRCDACAPPLHIFVWLIIEFACNRRVENHYSNLRIRLLQRCDERRTVFFLRFPSRRPLSLSLFLRVWADQLKRVNYFGILAHPIIKSIVPLAEGRPSMIRPTRPEPDKQSVAETRRHTIDIPHLHHHQFHEDKVGSKCAPDQLRPIQELVQIESIRFGVSVRIFAWLKPVFAVANR